MKAKNNARKILVILLSVVTLVCFSCGLLVMNVFDKGVNQTVYADVVDDKPADAVFEVDNKASVRLSPDGRGIKFKATMNEAYYNWLKQTYPTATFKVNVQVDSFANPGAPVVDTHTLVDADFQDGLDGATKPFVYYYTISYGALEEALQQQAFATVLKAAATVTISVPEQPDEVKNADGFSVRNMTAVAKYLVDTNNYNSDADKTVLESYYGNEMATQFNTPATIDFLHKASKGSEDVDVLTFASEVDAKYSFYINAIPLTRITATQYEISQELSEQLAYDTDYTVVAFDENNDWSTFTVHTYAGVIYDAEDFKEVFEISEAAVKKYAKTVNTTATATWYADFERDFTGNYVLANDISVNMNHTGFSLKYKEHASAGFINTADAGEITAKNPTLKNLFFSGTLDGQGHKLSVTLTENWSNNGVFGVFNGNPVIKNLQMNIVSSSSNNYILNKQNVFGTPVFDNCYLVLTETALKSGANHRLSDSYIDFTNSVIDYSGLAYADANYGGLLGLELSSTDSFENTIILGEKRYLVGGSGAAAKKYYAYNDGGNDVLLGCYRFDTYADFGANYQGIDLSMFDSKYWDVTTTNVPIFKGLEGLTLEFALEDYKSAELRIGEGETLDVTATYFGLPLADLTITPSNANVSISNGVLTANTVGSGTLEVSYTIDGQEVSYTVNFEVTQTAIEKTFEVYYSDVDKLIHGLDFEGDFVSAYQGSNEVTLSNGSNGTYTISGLVVEDALTKGATDLVVNTSTGAYKYTNVVTATKIIATESDWTYLNISKDDTTTKDGYVLVIKDLDVTTANYNLHTLINGGFVFNASLMNETNGNFKARGLRGTFDGNGHTIKVKTGKAGIFGVVVGLTVKDVQFIVDATSEYAAVGIDHSAAYDAYANAIFASGVRGATLDNVVVKLNSVTDTCPSTCTSGTGGIPYKAPAYFTFAVAMQGYNDTLTIKNSVIDYGTYVMDNTATTTQGALLTGSFAGISEATVTNLYIAHNGGYHLTYTYNQYNSQTNVTNVVAGTYYAKNEADDNIKITGAGKTKHDIYRFDTATALTGDALYTGNANMKWSYASATGWSFGE